MLLCQKDKRTKTKTKDHTCGWPQEMLTIMLTTFSAVAHNNGGAMRAATPANKLERQSPTGDPHTDAVAHATPHPPPTRRFSFYFSAFRQCHTYNKEAAALRTNKKIHKYKENIANNKATKTKTPDVPRSPFVAAF